MMGFGLAHRWNNNIEVNNNLFFYNALRGTQLSYNFGGTLASDMVYNFFDNGTVGNYWD